MVFNAFTFYSCNNSKSQARSDSECGVMMTTRIYREVTGHREQVLTRIRLHVNIAIYEKYTVLAILNLKPSHLCKARLSVLKKCYPNSQSGRRYPD